MKENKNHYSRQVRNWGMMECQLVLESSLDEIYNLRFIHTFIIFSKGITKFSPLTDYKRITSHYNIISNDYSIPERTRNNLHTNSNA